MSGILSAELPVGWRRCSSLGCGAPTGHDGAHVPEAVPPAAVAGPEVDVGAELAPTRAARIEAAARAYVAAMRAEDADARAGRPPGNVRGVTAYRALRAALCTCTAHGPDPACVEHGEALRAWQARHAP